MAIRPGPQPRLVWRAHRLSKPPSDALRAITDLPDGDQIPLPELPTSPLEKAAVLLRVAAHVEHALLVQYLYAGNSCAPPQRVILDIAIEEMSHLMTVQNLLRCIGQPPYLARQDDNATLPEEERLFPFDFRLEPLTDVSLAKYVIAESPPPDPAGTDPTLAHINELATGGAHRPVNRVGILYALLGAVFGTEEVITAQAAAGDAWYQGVAQIAAEAVTMYGSRGELHLSDDVFAGVTAAGQATDADWDRSVEKNIDEFRVHVVASRSDAPAALRDIGLQGEGLPGVDGATAFAGETSHFKRFHDLFVSAFGPNGSPPTVKPVPSGARIRLDPDGVGDDVISHPTTLRWAQLADLRYAILLGALERYLAAPEGDRAFLRGWCFAEMFALHRLSEALHFRPRTADPAPVVGGPPFTPPPWLAAGAGWADLVATFDESRRLAAALQAEPDTSSSDRTLLVLMQSSDERKQLEAVARRDGTTVRTRADEFRDILDWAAGAGDPGHFGESAALAQGPQSRWWNLQLNELLDVKVGANVVKPQDDGEPAEVITELSGADGAPAPMPANRPKLAPDSEEFKRVTGWVTDGCPKAPAQ